MINPECSFCDHEALQDRIVYFGSTILTIVSRPWFRPNHLLIIPKEHRKTASELTLEEDAEIANEVKILLPIISTDDGTIHFQKSSPKQVGNGIAMEHVHHHIYPILPSDSDTLVPAPRVAQDFYVPTDDEITSTIIKVQQARADQFK